MDNVLRAIGLLARRILVVLAIGAGGFAQAQQGSLPTLFSYQPTGTAADASLGVPATLNLAALSAVPPGGLVDFTTPDGRSFILVFDSLEAARPGAAHWIGHLNGSSADSYRAVLTWGTAGFGRIATPDGDFVLETAGGTPRLVDVARSRRRTPPMGDDGRAPPAPLAPAGIALDRPMGLDAPQSLTQIDVMVIYSSNYANRIGPDAVRTRIEFLVAVANQAYVDSQVNIQLNLVHTAPATYPYNPLDTALDDLTNGAGAFGASGINVANLRGQYGADLVLYLREFDKSVDTALVGVGWVNGGGAAPLGTAGMQAQFGFAVADDGSDISGTDYFSGDYILAHELGHTMGSAHDRANTNGLVGVFYYSFGYGDNVTFGTIMSYLLPTVGKFSNPAVLCGASSLPCGVSEAGNNTTTSANNALSLNNTRATVAAFMPATGLSTTPSAFSFTPIVGANANDTLVSEAITVGGLTLAGGIATGASAPISITGGQYSINGGTFTSAAGTVQNGDSVRVRVTASSTAYATATAYLTIGAVTRAFRATTRTASFAVAPAVAAGFSHSLALRADGTLFAWGQNDQGQLGDGTNVAQAVLPEALSIAGVTAIAASNTSTLALKSDGKVWAWGNNSDGEFGTGSTSSASSNVPVQISGLSGIQKISMGPYGGLAVNGSGAVYAWGFAGFGTGAVTQVTPLPAVSTAVAGNSFGLAIAADNTVWSWGYNASYQLGNTGPGFLDPAQIAGLSGITAIAAGDSHGLALKSNGTVWAWGDNSSGQLGIGSVSPSKRAAPAAVAGLPMIAGIAAGSSYSFAIGTDGSLWAWGDNTYGQLGDGSSGNIRSTPVKISIGNVAAVASYTLHTLALLTDGSVWAWGDGFYGELGNGAIAPSLIPTRAGLGFWYVGNADTEPSAFAFVSRSGPPGTSVDSAAVTVAGISQGAPVSVAGGLYSINGGAFTGAPGAINNGDQVRVRVTASATVGATKAATLTIGGVSAGYSVTTRTPRGDFDANGRSDVFWLNAGTMQTAGTTQTYVWEMNGATIASSGSPSSTGDPHWQVKGIGDFNGDGKADILYRHENRISPPDTAGTGATAIWLMNGLTIANSGSPGTVADLGWQVQGVGDFDGDGKADILWMHTDGRVQVWLMNGTTATSTPTVTNLGAGSGWSVQGIGDFNGDGKADILWMNTNGTVVIWLMNGATIASSATLANVGAMTATSWLVQGVGDFDGDGKADILWRNDDLGGIIYTWMMNGTTILSANAVTGVGTVTGGGWVVKSIGDYNGDGKADVFWKNDTALGGITYVWLMNGTGISSANAVTGVSDMTWQVQNPK